MIQVFCAVTSLVRLLPDVSNGSNAFIIRIKTAQEETAWPWRWTHFAVQRRAVTCRQPWIFDYTAERRSDLTSHYVCKLLHLRSNLLHQNRHVTYKIRHDFQRLAPLRHSADADLVLATQQTDNYVLSTTRMLKKKQSAGFYYGLSVYFMAFVTM